MSTIANLIMGLEELDPGPINWKHDNFKNLKMPRQACPTNKSSLIVVACPAIPNLMSSIYSNAIDIVSFSEDDIEDHMVDDNFDENADNALDDMFPEEVVPSTL